jgi:hypothetical protein
MNQLKAEVEGGDVSLDTVTRLIEASARAGKLAKVTIDAGVAVKLVEQRERNLELEGRLLTDVLANVVNGMVDALVPDPLAREAWRRWALDTAHAGLRGIEAGTQPELPAAPVEYAAVVEPIEADDVPVVGPEAPADRVEQHVRIDQDVSEAELPSWSFVQDSNTIQDDDPEPQRPHPWGR